MAWERAGTVSVTNNNAIVTGNGTNFVNSVNPGAGFITQDGRTYEVAEVISATQLRLATVYTGGSQAGQPYVILPTQSFARDLALQAAALINSFASVRDTIGQGLISDGGLVAPGIRFSADQDTGIRRAGDNSIAIVTGGADRVAIDTTAVYLNLPIRQQIVVEGAATDTQIAFKTPSRQWNIGQNVGGTGVGTLNFYDVTTGAARATIDQAGNFLIGTITAAYGTTHTFSKPATAGNGVAVIQSSATNLKTAVFLAVDTEGWNSAPAAMWVGKYAPNGRSMNASGTINASGADYAEYMRKAPGCGSIGKGDVCGVDANGELTKSWSSALSFVVKSTDPSYVGGDSWSRHLGPPPQLPAVPPEVATAPSEPPPAFDIPAPKHAAGQDVEAFEAEYQLWMLARSAAVEAMDRYVAAKAAEAKATPIYQDAVAVYHRDLAAWEGEMEKERQCVDRIAFSGQVPCNVAGAFAPGDYVVAVANGGGIKAVAVPAAEITFEQYRARVGKVWAERAGRAWIDVQHG